MKLKKHIDLKIHLEKLDEIKEVLPDIEPLQEKYEINLTIDVFETRTAITTDYV